MGFKLGKSLGIGSVVGPMMGSVIGAAGDYFSAKEQARNVEKSNMTNVYLAGQEMEFNKMEAEKARQFSAGQAQQQMDFQERMSNTSYQRTVEDMKKAGINPMFAMDQGGASTPSGAMGSSSTASGTHATVVPVPSVLQQVMSGAKDMIRLYSDWKVAMASADAARAQAGKAGVETKLLEKKNPEADVDYRIYDWFGKLLDRVADFSGKAMKNRGGIVAPSEIKIER